MGVKSGCVNVGRIWIFEPGEHAQITETFERMAAVVDRQNSGDALYKNMAGNFETSMAYKAACDLVFKGLVQPSGYTEPLLHAWRLKVKVKAG